MNDFHVPTPTSSTLLLSLLFSLVLLAAIRLVFLAYGALSKVSTSKEKLSQQEKADPVQHGRRRWTSMMRWSWTWEGLPLSLPISFSFSDQQIIGGVVGNGIGVSAPPPPTMKAMLHGKRTGPAFEHPLPAIYETEVPVSMAKMIMSRHTTRRPTPIRPPKRITVPAPRRAQSMV